MSNPSRTVKRRAPRQTKTIRVRKKDGWADKQIRVLIEPLRAWARKRAQRDDATGNACRLWLANKGTK